MNPTPTENEHADNQIRKAAREAEVRANLHINPGAEDPFTDQFVANIVDFEERMDRHQVKTVREYLPNFEFQDPGTLNEDTAKKALHEFFAALNEKNLDIDPPYLLSKVDYYRWLRDVFMDVEVEMDPTGPWSVNFIYTEIEPDSADNMNWPLKDFIHFLLDPSITYGAGNHLEATRDKQTHEEFLPGHLQTYKDQWQASYPNVEDITYTPITGRLTGEPNVGRFDFHIAYTVTLEAGTRHRFKGPGVAKMVKTPAMWLVRELSFPGLALPNLEEE